MNGSTPTVNGTLADVAAFFRVSERTVKRWVAAGEIGRWKVGGNLMFTEEDVVKRMADGYVASDRLLPVEAAARARREWRELLQVRGDQGGLQDLLRRVGELERRLVPDIARAA